MQKTPQLFRLRGLVAVDTLSDDLGVNTDFDPGKALPKDSISSKICCTEWSTFLAFCMKTYNPMETSYILLPRAFSVLMIASASGNILPAGQKELLRDEREIGAGLGDGFP